MRGTVLIVTMGIDYVAPARMPGELKRAGLRVGLIAPIGASGRQHATSASRRAYQRHVPSTQLR